MFGTFEGGPNHGVGDLFMEMETWASLADAKRALRLRAFSGGRVVHDGSRVVDFDERELATIGNENGGVCYPALDPEKCRIVLYGFSGDVKRGFLIASYHPVAVLSVGPRGGIRRQYC
ncbi:MULTISPECIES: hypothetical protein [Streptomyces]|uniref:hypothetical protein n=1 Tax=Streptomyces TaxID=1883 RepID=UPI00345C1796